jgi:hypothetical protein
MSCLRRICGDRSWGPNSTPYAEIRKQCQMPSIQNLINYHRLQWLGKVCRMSDDRLLLKILFGRICGRTPRGRPPTNLDRGCVGGFRPVVRVAWGVWNIHQLVGTVQRLESLDNSYSHASTNKQYMQNGISSGCSAVSLKCQMSNHQSVGGAGETDG